MSKEMFRKCVASPNQCAINVVLSFIGMCFVIGMNFNKLVIPPALLTILLAIPLLFSLVSVVAFVYWIVMFWNQYDGGERVLKLMGLTILTLLVLMPIYFLFRIVQSQYQ